MEREQFTFYASFAKAARKIRKPAERCAFYDAVIDYALSGISPAPGSLPDVVEMAMELVAPVLSSARRKAEAGRNGGKNASEKTEAKTDLLPENPKQEERKQTEASSKQSASKKEDKKEGEDKKEKENKCSISPPTPSSPAPAPKPAAAGAMEMAKAEFSGDLLTAVLDWLSYKRERREPYKEVGLRALFNQIRKAADTHGEAAVVEVIRNSMASGYMGITLDKLSSAPAVQKKNPKYMTSGTQNPLSSEEWDAVLDKI